MTPAIARLLLAAGLLVAPLAAAQESDGSAPAAAESTETTPATSGESAEDIRKSLSESEEEKPAEEAKPAEEPKKAEEKPAEEAKPVEEAKPAEETKPVEEAKPAPVTPAPAAPAPAPAVEAPVDNARQRVHAVVVRPDLTGGKFEVGIDATFQFAGKFTQHNGAGLRLGYHLTENLALVGGFDWYFDRRWTDFSERDLNGNANREPKAGPATLMQWNAFVGAEVAPIYGKFTFFDSTIVHMHFYGLAGIGLADTWVQLVPFLASSTVPGGRTFGEVGLAPTGQFGAGFRFYMGDLFTLRLEVRDTFFGSQPQTIYGCNMKDLENLASAGPNCRKDQFTAKDVFGNPRHMSGDEARAQTLLRDPSSGIVNALQFNATVSMRF